MAFPHLPWHFDLAFSSLVLKCSSNSLGGLIRGSENRISSAEELFDWLPPSASLTVFISWLSITISGCDWPDRIRWCCTGFLPTFDGFGKASLNDDTYWWNLFTWSLRLASDQECHTELSTENWISCMAEIKHTFHRGKLLELFPSLGTQQSLTSFFFSRFLFILLAEFF